MRILSRPFGDCAKVQSQKEVLYLVNCCLAESGLETFHAGFGWVTLGSYTRAPGPYIYIGMGDNVWHVKLDSCITRCF